MYFIQLSRQHRGRVVVAAISLAAGAALTGCSDQPTAPTVDVPSAASLAVGGGPKPICAKCTPTNRILYVKGDTVAKTGDIWVMNADGTGQQQVTSGAAIDDDHPAWSPDYTRIAYSSTRNGGSREIIVVNADGSGYNRLTVSDYTFDDDNPAWSPDGTTIYFERFSRDANFQFHVNIYAVSAAGGPATQITNVRGASFYDPSVSPDGKKILATRLTGEFVADNHLVTMNLNGSGIKQITSSSTGEIEGAWSPDGSKIVFVSGAGVTNMRDIATINADGTGRKNIVVRTGSQEHPSWARDGSAIVFADFGGVKKWGWLFSVKPDGTNLTQLEQTFDVGAYYSPSWSR